MADVVEKNIIIILISSCLGFKSANFRSATYSYYSNPVDTCLLLGLYMSQTINKETSQEKLQGTLLRTCGSTNFHSSEILNAKFSMVTSCTMPTPTWEPKSRISHTRDKISRMEEHFGLTCLNKQLKSRIRVKFGYQSSQIYPG